MTRYMLSVHSVEGEVREPMTEEAMQRSWQAIGAVEAEMRASDTLVQSARLEDASQAHVVRPGGSARSKTDGPFAETKEHLGGFYLIEASDVEAALGWASKVAQAIDNPIEVRGLVGYAD